MERRALGAVAGGVLVVGLGAGGYVVHAHQQSTQLTADAHGAADSFAQAWTARRPAAATYAGRTAAQVAASFTTATQGLGAAPVTVRVASLDRTGDQDARATLDVTWKVAGSSRPWTYADPVALHRLPGASRWAVVASGSTSLWHPQLPATGTGAAMVVRRTWGARGAIEDRSGSPLLSVGTVHDVQLDPARATPSSAAALGKVVGESSGSLVKKLAAAKKSGNRAPIPVITYRSKDFAAVQQRLAPLKGVIYPSRQQPLAANRTFGQPLLGSFGAVTADVVKAGGGRYVAGDYAGLSGVQGQYDARLGGTPGVTVTTSGSSPKTLFQRPATAGSPVRLTLDASIQRAAEQALGRTGSVPSALVAVDVKTGDVLAAANSPSFGFDRALTGRYQPGSTLKVATTYSLLAHGLSPSKPVDCPPKVVVNGLRIQNFEGETFGSVPFTKDFANSCNTAFVGLSRTMGNADVHDAAMALGVGAGWASHLGVTGTFDGSVPAATSATERAASVFGQGRTLASPVALAVMAASVARGSYVEPALVTTPAVSGARRAPHPLSPGPVGELRSLMRLVVTSGTAQPAFRGFGGAATYGKTGTAEYGNATPPLTRAWFAGWRGGVAFAVLVEKGRSGGTVAAPVARDFLQRIH